MSLCMQTAADIHRLKFVAGRQYDRQAVQRMCLRPSVHDITHNTCEKQRPSNLDVFEHEVFPAELFAVPEVVDPLPGR